MNGHDFELSVPENNCLRDKLVVLVELLLPMNHPVPPELDLLGPGRLLVSLQQSPLEGPNTVVLIVVGESCLRLI